MVTYKNPDFTERSAAARAAKERAIEALRNKAAPDPAVIAQRQAAREAREAAEAERRAAKRQAEEEAQAAKRAAKAAKEEALQAEAAAAQPAPKTAEELKAARDARYAARKARKK